MITRLLICALVVGAFIFAFFKPLQVSHGVIDATANLCIDQPTIQIKHYHLLLGQWNDYKVVKKHLLPSSTCGQPAIFKLYL